MSNISAANQYTKDEREIKCWDIYTKNLLKQIDNGYQAAIEAGYSEDHARNITMQGWFKERKERLKRSEIFTKAEKNLDILLDSKDERIKADLTKFTLKTLGSDSYSERTDVTTQGEKINTLSYEQATAILARRNRSAESNSEE